MGTIMITCPSCGKQTKAWAPGAPLIQKAVGFVDALAQETAQPERATVDLCEGCQRAEDPLTNY